MPSDSDGTGLRVGIGGGGAGQQQLSHLLADGLRGGCGVLVGEHDDGKAVVRIDDVLGREAGHLAAVLDRAVSGGGADVDPQPIAGGGAVLQEDIAFHLVVG